MKEELVYNFIRGLIPEAIRGKRGLLKTKSFQLDVYIPSLKKAIEFDGTFWHKSDWAVMHGAFFRDARKDRECLEAGIELLRINECDFDANRDSIFAKITAFLV